MNNDNPSFDSTDEFFLSSGSIGVLLLHGFSGSPPEMRGLGEFLYSKGATIYYLKGTKGWNTQFGGRPTAWWKPQARTGNSAAAKAPSTSEIWETLQTNSLNGGSMQPTESQSADDQPYRIHVPQPKLSE